MCMQFESYFQGFWIVELLTSGGGLDSPFFQQGVLSMVRHCHTQVYEDKLKNEDDLKNESNLKNKSNLKNENNLKNKGNPKNEDYLQNNNDHKN